MELTVARGVAVGGVVVIVVCLCVIVVLFVLLLLLMLLVLWCGVGVCGGAVYVLVMDVLVGVDDGVVGCDSTDRVAVGGVDVGVVDIGDVGGDVGVVVVGGVVVLFCCCRCY